MREADGMSLPCGKCKATPKPRPPREDKKTPLAQLAAKEFYATLQAKRTRLDANQLDFAWNSAVEVVRKNLRTSWMVERKPLDGSIDPPPEVSVFGEKE